MASIKKVQVVASMGEGFTVESQIRNHKVFIDQPEQGGGKDTGPTPLELLFFSLAGCLLSIARIAANQKRIALRSMEVRIEGEIDSDGLLGKNKDVRVGFPNIKAFVKMDADMTEDQKREFLEEVDLRCPVSDNLHEPTPVALELLE